MGSDARVHPRLQLSVTADVIGEEVMLRRPLGDISLGGCRFDGPAWEAVGTGLTLVLDFPSGAQLPVQGTVVRASRSDMGVRFCDVSDEQKWGLRKHVREGR
ncbi:PilZ domain-containing protein [Pseudenhygromyxa sp. WMMC2535]|uniref:PilZ domain-containing protein n=1 Tax=Pseudenhygromyxa sp. WMMC2535 TaxID=2712867 RepID=UPI001553B9FF|nr:PilZ domain-containing protein [Pseudenhygromyxa sp. WMMC2535]